MGERDLTVGAKRMGWYDPHRLMKLVAGMLLTRIKPRGDQTVEMGEEDIVEVVALETLEIFHKLLIRYLIQIIEVVALETLDITYKMRKDSIHLTLKQLIMKITLVIQTSTIKIML